MSDEAAFLKAIADQPAERSTRLVYADWLDEHGRPREAEFLRLQIQAAEMNARLLELGSQLRATWLTTVRSVQTNCGLLELRTGRNVILRELRQRDFYDGQLEGNPPSSRNREGLERLIAEEHQRWNLEPYAIQPLEQIVTPRLGSLDDEQRGWFPQIACVGRFISLRPARDKSQHASTLTVIWFQHEWAFPIDPGVYEQIRAIEWEQHAHDFHW